MESSQKEPSAWEYDVHWSRSKKGREGGGSEGRGEGGSSHGRGRYGLEGEGDERIGMRHCSGAG